MKALRKVFRPRWLVALAFIAAAAVPAALVATTGVSAVSATTPPIVSAEHPIVDARAIYANDFYESTHFLYKAAGSDGPLANPSDINNLPQNYNGDQEFNKWWGETGSTHLPEPNGPLGRFMTVRSIIFPVREYQYNDVEIMIPGGNCAGQNVEIGSHPDSTPIGTNPASGAQSGSATPTSTMHSGDWGAGSAYDANMGSNMNFEEIGSVLRWHDANGTYPSKTLRETLYEAELAGLVGSAAYSSAGTPATLLQAPTSVGATNIKVASTSNLGVGTTIAMDEVNTENPTVLSVGTAAGTATTLTAPSAVGDTNIRVASVSGATVGHQYRVDATPNDEYPTVATVGTASSTATTLAAPAAAADTNIKVASITGMTAGAQVRVDAPPNLEVRTVATVGTAAKTATALAAPAAPGDTNIKVASVTNLTAGEQVRIDTGANLEMATIAAGGIGTSGNLGTGVTLTAPLALAHANLVAVQDVGTGVNLTAGLTSAHAFGAAAQALGTGITFTAPLTIAHAFGAQARDLGTGITLTAPLTKAHALFATVNGSATGQLSDSPQQQVVMVLNNDQDGLDYPAPKWGTDHYMNDLVNGGVGPWFNNINATPIVNTGVIYSPDGFARLQHNLPAVIAFRTSVAAAVAQAFADLGQKYNFSVPLENPDLLKNTGSVPDDPTIKTRPAYSPADQAIYSPVLDDHTGRTDQVSFGNRGIPSLGDIGQYDSSTDPLIGGNENPYPTAYPSKPGLSGMYGQDSSSDYFSNLNFWASGTVHGPGGYDQPSEGLLRGVETIATWFSYVIASPAGGGKLDMPDRPIAYFQTIPRKPTAQTTVSFDAGFSRRGKDGLTAGEKFYWDFGDGSPMVLTENPTIVHTFPTQAAWRDVKLLVNYGGKWGAFRAVEPIDFFPTYYPAVAPATEPLPPTTGPAADPCGTLSSSEMTAMEAAAKKAIHAPAAASKKD